MSIELEEILRFFWDVFLDRLAVAVPAEKVSRTSWISISTNRCVLLNTAFGLAVGRAISWLGSVSARGSDVVRVESVPGKFGDRDHTWIRFVLRNGKTFMWDLTAFQWEIFDTLGPYPLHSDFVPKEKTGYWIDSPEEVADVRQKMKDMKRIREAATPIFDILKGMVEENPEVAELMRVCDVVKSIESIVEEFEKEFEKKYPKNDEILTW